MEDTNVMRIKRRKHSKSKRRGKKATKCHDIHRRMGSSGMRTIRICPGKPARIVG